jgi:lysophospholipase L1-like esterase
MKQYLLLFLLLIAYTIAGAQAEAEGWDITPPAHYAFIHYTDNAIAQPLGLDDVFKKLVALRATKKGKVSIVHIGDSHIQGDGITKVLRNGFRQYFGDAGRGLVFPYHVAGTNGPQDISSSSNVSWRINKLTNPGSLIVPGITGYGMETDRENASIHMQLKEVDGHQEYFDRLVFFLGAGKAVYNLSDSGLETLPSIETKVGADTPSVIFETDVMRTGFQLIRTVFDPGSPFNLYGVSMEHKDDNGVIYHTIGVNGARYDQYTEDDLFWHQLAALHGDLFIISMGTNEAQNRQINDQALTVVVEAFVKKIHRAAPGAEILITTPAGSYYKMRKPNASVQQVSRTLSHFCSANGYACWDLDHIDGGKAGAQGWRHSGLMSHDFVHYNAQGYQLQGELLLSALAKAYNSYAKAHPYKAPKMGMNKAIAPVKSQEIAKKNMEIIRGSVPNIKQDTTPVFHTKKLKVEYSE